jgi:hypothetical protein
VRVLVNFQHYDGWSIHCLAEDAHTVLTEWTRVSSGETMLRLFRACGANEETMAEVERKIAVWGRGGVWLDVDVSGQKLLRIPGSTRKS